MNHFIRGFFDGNGSVYVTNNRINITFYSTHDFLITLKKRLINNIGVNNNSIFDKKNVS